MPAVLVHGVPDTPELWRPVLELLDRTDVLTPQLPGFGIPLPDGFSPTKETYVEWLVAELEAIGEPVDLVGHDWGSLIVQRIASIRRDGGRAPTALELADSMVNSATAARSLTHASAPPSVRRLRCVS